MAWNAVKRWWEWVYNTRRPLPWIEYDTSGAPSAVFCIVHPATRGKLSELSTAAYNKAIQDASERYRIRVDKEVANALARGRRAPTQLTAEAAHNVILQYDVVQTALNWN